MQGLKNQNFEPIRECIAYARTPNGDGKGETEVFMIICSRLLGMVDRMMSQASRTVNPLHFEDLEPHRFEDLIRQLAHGFRQWRTLEATGRLGMDEGVDIRGVEAIISPGVLPEATVEEDEVNGYLPVDAIEEREWRFQCKRYKEIGPTLMRSIVEEAVPDPISAPYGLIIAAACDVSAKTMADFHTERTKRGVSEGILWTKAHLEDLLFRPENDHILFAYFGISLVARRRSRVQDIRTELTIKRKIMRALDVDKPTQPMYKNILVRDVDDTNYPYEEQVQAFGERDFSPWHPCIVDSFFSAGVIVDFYRFRAWVKPDGTWDITPRLRERCGEFIDNRRHQESQEKWAECSKQLKIERKIYDQVPKEEQQSVTLCVLLPFSSILEVDPWGDPIFEAPHFFCRFSSLDWGPYTPKYCYYKYSINQWSVVELDPEKRTHYFDPVLEAVAADQEKSPPERYAEAQELTRDEE